MKRIATKYTLANNDLPDILSATTRGPETLKMNP